MIKTEKRKLDLLQEQQEKDWESVCINCGACCGANDGDPCINLAFSKGKSRCTVYNNRLGIQKTLKGREFKCLPVRDIMFKNWPGDHKCSYKINLKHKF